MGTAPYPSPSTIEEAVAVLNEANPDWNLSLQRGAEKVFIIAGDQLAFIADNEQEAAAFLDGCIFATPRESNVLGLLRKRKNARPGSPDIP